MPSSAVRKNNTQHQNNMPSIKESAVIAVIAIIAVTVFYTFIAPKGLRKGIMVGSDVA
jgi:choline-glycine betaine transporter